MFWEFCFREMLTSNAQTEKSKLKSEQSELKEEERRLKQELFDNQKDTARIGNKCKVKVK